MAARAHGNVSAMVRHCISATLALLMASGGMSGPAAAQDGTPILELQIAAAGPCADLPLVTHLDRLRLDDVMISVRGPELTATASGYLRCRGSGNAVLQATAAAQFMVEAQVTLATCTAHSTQVTLTDLAAATVLMDPFSTQMETVLGAHASHWARATCQALLNRP